MNESIMNNIRTAAKELKLLQIVYTDAKGKPSIRTIEPYEIKDNALFGFDTSKNAIRRFTLNQIQSAQIHLSEFTPRWPIQIS